MTPPAHCRRLIRSLAIISFASLAACASTPATVEVDGTPDPRASGASGATASAAANSSSAAPTTHHDSASAWRAERGSTQLRVTDGPGVLVDTNAPPPPPGAPIPHHPFLGASCGGDMMACNEASTLLGQSSSTREFLDKLAKAGFVVTPEK